MDCKFLSGFLHCAIRYNYLKRYYPVHLRYKAYVSLQCRNKSSGNSSCFSSIPSKISMSKRSITLTVPVVTRVTPSREVLTSTGIYGQYERPLTPSLTPIASPSPSPPTSPSPPLSPSGFYKDTIIILQKCISMKDTKASSTTIDRDIKELCHLYKELNKDEKLDLILYISKFLSINHKHVSEIINQIPAAPVNVQSCSASNVEALMRWEDKLKQCLQPSYHWLAQQISRLPGGVKFIIDMRAELLDTIYSPMWERDDLTSLKALDVTLRDLLALWFTVGLLDLKRITWESSCDMLEKISGYEAVHPIRNWTDLKRRVGSFRRCFVFTHSCMPLEPLVVLHTFLTDTVSCSMSKIMEYQQNKSANEAAISEAEEDSVITTAIFYSITSTQKGLRGIELGNYLIKRVVNELQAEFPHMSQFSSLSPIPEFVKWLEGNLVKAQRDEVILFSPSEIGALMEEFGVVNSSDAYAEIRRLLKTNGWATHDMLKNILEAPLMRLCAYYLYFEKRRGYAFDPVANFHLRNGAVMWRLNWDADRSPRGMSNSCGIMVNYRYFLEDSDSNSLAYLEQSKINASDDIVNRAKTAKVIREET